MKQANIGNCIASRYIAYMQSHLLEQSASESLSQLIEEQLKSARRNLKHIEKRDHGESLHDFRVSLRRLRIWLKVAGRDEHIVLPKSDRKRVKNLVQLTNEARDLEVRLSLFRQHLSGVELDDKEALGLQRKWKAQIDKDYATLIKAALKDLKKAEPGIKNLVQKIRKNNKVTLRQLSFRDWLIPVLLDYAHRTDEALFKIKSLRDRRQSHEARLLAKALRYLIEPLSDELARSSGLLNILRRVQDLIGGLRDAQMLALELDKAIRKTKTAKKVQALKNARERNAKEIRYLYGELQNKFLRLARPQLQDKVEHLFLKPQT